MLKNIFLPVTSSVSTCSRVPHFSQRQMSQFKNFHPPDLGKLSSKTTNLLLEHALTTDDDPPDELGPIEKKRKPRHQKKAELVKDQPIVDLSDKSVLLFPGQGAQFLGMGKRLLETPSVKELYDEASQILGYDLLGLCLNGPKSILDQTQYCQAATVVTSLAAVEMLYRKHPDKIENCMAVAGFSVGEITAAIFTGALSLGEGINLVKIRGEAMQAASDLVESGMMTVFIGADSKLGFGCQVAAEWAKRHQDVEDPVCQVANHLYAGAKVIAGHDIALRFLEQNKSDFNIRKMSRLPVSGAFHTPLMVPAMEPFSLALENTKVRDPRVPIYSNYDNKIITQAKHLKKYLPKQMISAVKWESSINSIFKANPQDVLPKVFECGPGRSLSTVLGKINGRAAKSCQYIQC